MFLETKQRQVVGKGCFYNKGGGGRLATQHMLFTRQGKNRDPLLTQTLWKPMIQSQEQATTEGLTTHTYLCLASQAYNNMEDGGGVI